MKRVGLFIGVNQYTNGIQPLRCACSDAQSLGVCFAKKQFDEVDYLLNEEASSGSIISKVKRMTGELSSGDLFVLYFAGHGREFAGNHYLIGADGYLDTRVSQGQLTVSELLAVSEAPGVNRLFILDCCRTALVAGRDTACGCPVARNLSLGKALARDYPVQIIPPFILNSCSPGQQAFELQSEKHGVFTKALQQVLEDTAHPVRDFSSLIDRVDAAIETLVPPGMVQTLDQSCNPRKWGQIPLFADWETPAAPTAAAIRQLASENPAAAIQHPVPAKPAPAPRPVQVPVQVPTPTPAAAPAMNSATQSAAETPTSPEAQYELGMRCFNGIGAPRNYETAAFWFRKAAEQGHVEAQKKLGSCYERGLGVPRNSREAVKWFRKAEKRKLAEERNAMGQRCAAGQGLAQSYEKAVFWYSKAAALGLAEAQYNLGECYCLGRGVPKDTVKAAYWFRKAAAQGDEDARQSLNRLGEN